MKKNRSKWYLVCSTFIYAICAGMSIYSALLLGKIIDSATAGNVEELFYYLIFCAILFCVYLIFTRIGIAFRMAYVQNKMVVLKKETIKQILFMPISLYKEKDQAYYVNTLTTDSEKVEEDHYCSIPMIAFSICSFICAVVSLIYVNYVLLISYFVFFMVALMLPQLLTGNLTQKQKVSSVSNELYVASIKELSEGWETIKLNESGREYYNRIEGQIEENQKKRCQVRGLQAFVSTVSEMSGSFSQLACIAFGGYLVTKGSISVGDLIIAIQLVQIAFSSISDASDRITRLNAVKPFAIKLKQMYLTNSQTQNEPVRNKGNEDNNVLISYQNISFGFEQKQILKDFNCNMEKNKIYAIVGESGKGKSTIARLLLKYYNDYSGDIIYCGKNTRELGDMNIYSNIKYVSQDTYLFNDSIRNNITLYQECDRESFDEVIRRTNLTELLECYGEQTIGDFGNRISGGERQRIALARAILRQPEVIIFDEPTSALDPKNTKEILEVIFGLENVTRIVITHIWDEKLFKKFDGVIRLE